MNRSPVRTSVFRRGFTLVELMIVVAMIGVLASMAVYSMRRFLTSSKTAEALNTLGEIQRGAVAAYERESSVAVLLPDGSTNAQSVHVYCDSATPVPASAPAGRKYQPSTSLGKDFNTGTANAGWRCLRFSMSAPHYYQYAYTRDGRTTTSKVELSETVGWTAEAVGDINGNGFRSEFLTFGTSNNGLPKVATQIRTADPDE